jgi:hypothetical protein
LVDGPAPEAVESAHHADDEGILLGFVSMSSLSESDDGFRTILTRIQPSWVFDLRPAPYFNIGQLNRIRAFDLFSSLRATYRDVAGRLRITDRKDASLNSGAVARYIAEALSTRSWRAPVVVLVDDRESLSHALRVLPSHLKSSAAWCAFELSAIVRDGVPDLILRTPQGEAKTLQPKWLGDRGFASPE